MTTCFNCASSDIQRTSQGYDVCSNCAYVSEPIVPIGPHSTVFTLPGADNAENKIVVTYTSWGPMSMWDVTSTAIATPYLWQNVTNENGQITIGYTDLNA